MATKKMKTGGMTNPNKAVTVSKTPTKYTGGKNASASVQKITPKASVTKGSNAPAKVSPSKKMGGSTKSKKSC